MADSKVIITNESLKSPIAEAYKTLRTNIQFSGLDKELKVIMVTSGQQSEGKSTTAANLAITMAQTDKKVLLIDCDLRRPSLHRAFSILNVKGLTNVLVQDLDYKEICNTVGVKNLEVLTSGPKPPNPSELIGTLKMESFLSEVSSEYDTIIIDAPPVLPVTDAVVLSRLVDGLVLVAAYGVTTYEAAQDSKEALEKVGAKILGVVINGYPFEKSGGRYASYYEDVNDTTKKKRGFGKKNMDGLKRVTFYD